MVDKITKKVAEKPNEENWKDWEDEADVRPIYNDAQMLNGSFEGDTIHQINKKHQKKKEK